MGGTGGTPYPPLDTDKPSAPDPELAELIQAWPTLPMDVRKMIAGVVRLTPKAATEGE